MVFMRYTHDELIHLRSSPLVKKPDRLPPIEQWIEYVFVDGKSTEKLRIPHSESQQVNIQGDKVPRTTATHIPRSAVSGDKSPMGNFSTGQRPSLLHTRTTGSRSGDDFLPKPAFTSTRSITRLTSYTASQSTDALPEDGDEPLKPGDRHHTRKSTSTFDRENWSRRPAGDDDVPDSNGDKVVKQGRDVDKSEGRWPPRDDRRHTGDRQTGGWRDREQNRRDRPWDRNDHSEQDPEWFDTPAVVKQEDDFSSLNQPRTQEDFQKWKTMMNANKKPQQEDLPEEKEVQQPQEQSRKVTETLKIEGLLDAPFGGFSTIKSPDSAAAQSRSAKASRFASMFKKEDSPQMTVPDQHPPASAPPAVQQENREDKEGFQRIMQMLGGATIDTDNAPRSLEAISTTSPKRSGASGARQRSRFFDSAKSPESAPTQERVPSSAILPNGENPFDLSDASRPHHERSMSSFQGSAPTPDVNLQALLANQRTQRSAASNKDSEFLLGLLQGAGARPAHAAPAEIPQWTAQHDSHTARSRGPLHPGQIDENLLRGGPPDFQRGPQPLENGPRAPPGLNEQSRPMQPMQQRNGPDLNNFSQQFDQGQPRRPPGLPPGMPLPSHIMLSQQPGPHMPAQSPHEMPFMQPPPPGLPPHLRHPQGFANIPNIFQAPQQQMQPPQQHFGNNGAVNQMAAQQNGNMQHMTGRSMPIVPNSHLPPGLGPVNVASSNAQPLNGAYGRGQQQPIYDQRR